MGKPEDEGNPVQAASGDIVFAAGGIVERNVDGKTEILIIERSRYGKQWCLPKGKPNPNETLEDTAERAVKEKTQCSAKIMEFARTVNYLVDGKIKIVFYWRMNAKKEDKFKKNDNVETIKWVEPEAAWAKLTHRNDKELTSEIYFNTIDPKPEGWLGGCLNWFKNILQKLTQVQQKGRLGRELETFNEQLNHRISNLNSEEWPEWAVSASRLVKNAKKSLRDDHPQMGWALFNAAKRMEILGLDNEELENMAKILRFEAAKLSEWRRKAVFALIGDGTSASQPELEKKAVWWAAQLKDEYFSNRYFKISLRRNNLLWVFLLLVMTLCAILLVEKYMNLPVISGKLLFASALFGSMGALLSVAFTLSKSPINQDIPDQILGSFVTWMRPAIGAASGMVVYIFILAGMLKESLNQGLILGPGVYMLAFVSGFSERFIVGAIEKVAGKEEKKKENN